MEVFLYLVASVVSLALQLMYWSMLAEAILSWFLPEDSLLRVVLAVITMPIVFPVRAILSRFPTLQEFPIDISFFVAFLLLGFLRVMLPAISYPI